MNTFLKILIVSLLFTGQNGFAADKMNVILFVVDDLGYYDLSLTGSKLYETPNIDNLAHSGIRFSNAYVSHPRCTPSRYSIQTGKFPARAQIPGGEEQMKLSEVTIGEAFHEAGYTTFFAGKWHLGKTESHWPQNQGYDINVGGCSAGAPPSYFFPYNQRKKQGNGKEPRKIVGLEKGVEGEYITDRLTNETISFIKKYKPENTGKPFFAVLCHYAVHTPLEAKKEKIKKYKEKLSKLTFSGPAYIQKDGTTKMFQDNAVYAAMIESMDESLGKLVDALKREGIYNNTVIVFTSDHGGLSNRGCNSKRALATSNLPLRAGKGHVYEGGVKVPFFIYWPGVTKENSFSTQVTVNTDIYPTLLDIAGIPLKPEQHLDGISLVSAIKNNAVKQRTIFWHSPIGRPTQTGDENCSSIRVGNFKLIDFYDENRVELYNLKNDPYEKTDLSISEKVEKDDLLNKLNRWKQEIHAVRKKAKK
ncbi:MAG: sulfatase [Prolixibacteraceae bacterium]|nr:sulfatase [Prolixibacteraceae bacterium]